MRVLIFSDTHLTRKFDQTKFRLLEKIINEADKVIINGDFWDSRFTNFEGFINSKWSKLFPLLKEKDTVYLFGNHDPSHKCDSRVRLFSEKASDYYKLKLSGSKYHIEHGHKILKGKRALFVNMLDSFLTALEGNFVGNSTHRFLYRLELLSYRVFGMNILTESRFAKRGNAILKRSRGPQDFLICGHTHCPEFDLKNMFANSGCIFSKFASYLYIDGEDVLLNRGNY